MKRPVKTLNSGGLQRYWSELSRNHLNRPDDDLAVVCFAGMPAWFNRFYAVYQDKAFQRLLAGEDFAGARVLDAGTGLGRWAQWYAAWPGTRVVGIDIEPLRLAAARTRGNAQFLEMPVDRLAFADESFDVVNSVTVLQHVEHEAKREAIAEFARVLRPGGRAVILELTDTKDDAPHVFAWPDAEWRHSFAQNGFRVERIVGDQYAPLLRMMKSLYSLTRGREARAEIDKMKGAGGGPASRFMLPLRLAVMASYPIEEAARFLPAGFARHTGYLLRKV